MAAAGQGTLHIVSHFQVSSIDIFVYVFFTAFLFIFFLLIFPGVLIILVFSKSRFDLIFL